MVNDDDLQMVFPKRGSRIVKQMLDPTNLRSGDSGLVKFMQDNKTAIGQGR